MWWIGFRAVFSGTKEERNYDCGKAAVLGPFDTRDLAKSKIKVEWDARYSAPFEAKDLLAAQGIVENQTPTK